MDNLLPERDDANNGVGMLLDEIRRLKTHLPPEHADDAVFGGVVVLYEMGKQRSKRIKNLERVAVAQAAAIALVFLTILALHADVPWLTDVVRTIFGT